MEPAQPGIDRAHRYARTGFDVLGEACVERGGEAEPGAPRPASRGNAQRPFRGDVQRVRLERLDHACQAPARQH